MGTIIYKLKENIFSLLFTILGIEIIFYSICGNLEFINALIMASLIVLFFIVYEFVDMDKKKGSIIYLIVSAIVVILSYILIVIAGSNNNYSFLEWLLQGISEINDEGPYVAAAIIIISFIFSSMYYYFSVKIIRMSVLLLLFFVSMILYIKGPYSSGNIAIYSYIVSFFLVYIKSAQGYREASEDKKRIYSIKTKDILIVGITIVLIVFSTSSILPNVDVFPKISVLDSIRSYFREFDLIDELKGFVVENTKSRNVNEATEKNRELVLYTYTGDKIEYLISQAFDYYDMYEMKWVKDNEDYSYGNNIKLFDKSISIDRTKSFLSTGNTNLDDQFYDEVQHLESDEGFKKYIHIKNVYKESNKMIHPSKTISVNDITNESNMYLNGFDELFKTKSFFEVNEEYSIISYSDEPKLGSKEDLIMKYFNDERYTEFIKEFNYTDEYYDSVKLGYTGYNYNSSEKIKKLAEDLTKDQESYYYKAKAIEDYFTNGEYIYKLDIKKYEGKDFVENFIFNTKEGYCVQYATAMTIMCRSIGIPARYVEGYLVTDQDETTKGFEVNAARGHAFVEVYIPGFGWKIFDPTPGITEENESVINFNVTKVNFNNDYGYITVGIVIVIIIVCIYLISTKRKRKIKHILKKENEEIIELLIKDIVEIFEKLDIALRKEETLLAFSRRIDKEINVELETLIQIYYKNKYANQTIKKEDIDLALKVNQEVYAILKKKRREKK